MVKTAEEFVTFGQGNVEALVKSGQILAAGMQDMTRHLAATAQASFDEALSAFRAMASARSVREAMDVQTALVRSTIEKALTQPGQVAESNLKLAEKAMAPIATRLSLAVETFGKSA